MHLVLRALRFGPVPGAGVRARPAAFVVACDLTSGHGARRYFGIPASPGTARKALELNDAGWSVNLDELPLSHLIISVDKIGNSRLSFEVAAFVDGAPDFVGCAEKAVTAAHDRLREQRPRRERRALPSA